MSFYYSRMTERRKDSELSKLCLDGMMPFLEGLKFQSVGYGSPYWPEAAGLSH